MNYDFTPRRLVSEALWLLQRWGKLYLIQVEAIYLLPDTALKSQIAILKLQIISKLQIAMIKTLQSFI